MSDEPKELEGDLRDKSAEKGKLTPQEQNKLAEIQNPDITRFLLQGLEGNVLDAAVRGTEIDERVQKSEAERLRAQALIKADEDAVKYGLNEEDRAGLEMLYQGFSQADLIEINKGYTVRITQGESTQYADLPQKVKSSEQYSDDSRLNILIPERVKEKVPFEKENLIVSAALWNAIISEFSYIREVFDGEQIRKSPNPLFARTAIYGLSHNEVLKTLIIGPVNETQARIRDLWDTRKQIISSMKKKS